MDSGDDKSENVSGAAQAGVVSSARRVPLRCMQAAFLAACMHRNFMYSHSPSAPVLTHSSYIATSHVVPAAKFKSKSAMKCPQHLRLQGQKHSINSHYRWMKDEKNEKKKGVEVRDSAVTEQ
ncbi:unnamed protein product [Arctia plantaginis]|uniref:Uncharacterized protein n=1 Tax=Arctia plantaginis TaxID=874455 RepID=A0A8S1ANH9_ARCPL|nr:unnamed protein product [Arctia plantaginis]